MRTTDEQVLKHIIAYCEQVEKAVDRFGKNSDVFMRDEVYQNAVSMPIMQIGELTKRLTPEFRVATEREFHWKAIAGMRDRYAHGYLEMDPEKIWDTATQDIPVLRQQCEELLEQIFQLEQEEAREKELEDGRAEAEAELADARQQTSPRSFLVAIRHACDDSRENHSRAEYAIPSESIKVGVQAASEIRVTERQEDNPWAEDLLTLLKGVTVPCPFEDVQALWEKRYPQGPKELVAKHPLHTPPEFASQRWQDVREQLERLGFCMTLGDGRFNMPDLYRVGFRLGRKGGVKPLP